MLRTFNGNKPPHLSAKKWGGKGIGIIEILVVVAILGITLTTLLGLASFSLGTQDLARQTVQAKDLAQEAMEAVRSIRDNRGWGLIVNGSYGLENISGYWNFAGTNNIISGFTRTVLIVDGRRESGSDNIVESGGDIDPDTKKITVRVEWIERSRPHSIELKTYLTNWR